MKKLLLLSLLFSNAFFAQKISKEKLIDALATTTCDCVSKKEVNKNNVELIFGACVLQDLSKYEEPIKKYYGKGITTLDDSNQMEALGKDVGLKMAQSCPEIFQLLLDDVEDDTGVESEYFSLSGKVASINSDQFLTLNIKESTGKNSQFILLDNFENAYLLTDKVLQSEDDVEISYYELELYDTKLQRFLSFKIISDIIKK